MRNDMNMMKYLAFILIIVPFSVSRASTVEITADFKIDPAGRNTKFVNTTPTTGLCHSWPENCRGEYFSVDTGLRGTKRWERNEDHGYGLKLGIPGAPRKVTVRRGTESHALTFRITGHSLRAERIAGEGGLAFSHFGGRFSLPTGNCSSGGTSKGNTEYIANMWVVKTATDSACETSYIHDTPRTVRYVPSIGYELISPNPLAMHSGTYTGSLTYSVGPGKEFDYFYNAEGFDPELVLNFTLTVQHDLKIDFPGSTQGHPVIANLEPPGGWVAWQGHSATPPRLIRDLAFRLSLSGPLKVYLSCEDAVGERCAIRREDDLVPFDVSMTLPGAHTSDGHQPIVRTKLPTTAGQALVLEPQAGYLNAMSSLLHFATDKEGTARVMQHPGSTYEGAVTMIFDAD
jgi:hypothetical protein